MQHDQHRLTVVERRGGRPVSWRRRWGLPLVIAIALATAGCGSRATTLTHTSQARLDALIREGLSAQTMGNATRAASLYQAALAIDHNDAIALYDLGDVQQLDLHEESAAASNYEKALVVDPKLTQALFNLAILETTHSPKFAVADYRRLLSYNNHDAAAYLNLGYVLSSLGQVTEGRRDIARATQLEPALNSRRPPGPLG